MKENIVIGKIIGAHSIHGEIKVFPITDEAERFLTLDYFLIGDKRYEVKSVRMHKGNALISSPEIEDRNAAEALSGKLIEVKRADALELSEGQYFIEDLKGIEIRDSESAAKGIINDILQNGAVDIIEYKIGGDTYLMPYLKEYVSEVNLEGGYMKADFSKGLKA